MKKLKRLLPVFLFALLLSACTAPENSPSYKQISVSEAVKMMEEENNYIILDVRRADEYATGHIPGAINVANESIGTEEIPELPKDATGLGEVLHFAECIRENNRNTRYDIDQAILMQSMLNAIYASAKLGREVTVDKEGNFQ